MSGEGPRVLAELNFVVVRYDKRKDAIVHQQHVFVALSEADEIQMRASRLEKIRRAIRAGGAVVLKEGGVDVAYEVDHGKWRIMAWGTPEARREKVKRFPWEDDA